MTPVHELAGATAPIWMWTPPQEVESAALDQLRTIAELPYVHHHVAVMPDVHLGKGATVGSVIALRDAVSPAAVGVDIGCGMAALRTNLTAADLPDDLRPVRAAVEAAIPVGHRGHTEISRRVRGYADLWGAFGDLHPKVTGRSGSIDRVMAQMGSLGSGNHFVELCLDTEDAVWLMLHSGSRNIGKTLAELHIAAAKKLPHNTGLRDRDLSVFLAGTPEMAAYRADLTWAQTYARRNRDTMLALYVDALRDHLPTLRVPTPPTHGPHAADTAFAAVNCHHNYVAEEHHYGADVLITRKGAISARAGEYGIIPGSMGTRSYIVRGLGSAESFHSAAHGAGRRMSRTRARKEFTTDDLVAQTTGVECRKDPGVLDEIPAAYKDIDAVIAHQSDLVDVAAELRAVLCVKG
ncbi:RtcB family protein [Frankia sp. Mgl5]|uniref:RtcB family protein n=1 Tax=Frankia sp. Mgl5 TaxID=2933793 RepID=UPI0027E4FC64|nr:RtcB family protein [Frankia sp. Mgl5]